MASITAIKILTILAYEGRKGGQTCPFFLCPEKDPVLRTQKVTFLRAAVSLDDDLQEGSLFRYHLQITPEDCFLLATD